MNEYKPKWTCIMPEGCPPEDILVAEMHPFFRLSLQSDSYSADDFKSKARRNLKLPMFRKYQGIIALTLNPTDGVVKQTGAHRSHYTWWRTTSFQMSNLNMLAL